MLCAHRPLLLWRVQSSVTYCSNYYSVDIVNVDGGTTSADANDFSGEPVDWETCVCRMQSSWTSLARQR